MRAPSRLPLLLVFLVLFAGNFVHAAGPELPVGDTVVGPAPFVRWQPAIAANGSELFTVWVDSRVPQNRVVGARMDESGKVLDPTGIPISGSAFSPASDPAVVWNGSSWMVFWNSFLPGQTFSGIIAARVDRDGRVTGAPYMLASGAAGEGQYAASNGELTVVVYAAPNGTTAHALILDRDGHLVRNLEMPSPWVSLDHPSVTTDGTGFLVVWGTLESPSPSIEAVRIDSSGNLRDATPAIVATGRNPFVASDGNGYLLLAQRDHEETHRIWTTTPIAADLTSGATANLPDGALFQSPSLFYRNGNYYVIGQRNSDVILKLDLAAVLLGRDGTASAPVSLADLRSDSVDPQTAAAITSNGKVAVVWDEVANEPSFSIHTRARLFDGLNRATSPAPILISASGNPHYGQAMAYGNGMYVVAWRGLDTAYVTRVTADGRTLDGTGIRLDDATWASPAVAFDGTNFVVAYATKSSLTLRFVSPAFGLLDAKITLPAREETGGERPSLAISSDAIYVAWADASYVMVTRIPHATHVAETTIEVSPQMPVTQPQLAWNGSQLLVAWSLQEFFVTPPIPQPNVVYAARITPAMTLLDPAPLVIAEGDDAYTDAAVASNGKDWLIAWQHGPAIEARRLRADGILGDPAVVIENGWLPALIFDGTRYAIAWKETDPRSTLRLATLPNEGALVRAGVATIAATDSPLFRAALAPTPNGIAAAYAKVSNAHGGVERTFLRVMKSKKRAAGN